MIMFMKKIFTYEEIKTDTDRLGIKFVATKGAEYISLTRDPQKSTSICF